MGALIVTVSRGKRACEWENAMVGEGTCLLCERSFGVPM